MLIEVFKKATMEPAVPANLLTITRLAANLFKNLCFHEWLQLHRSEVSVFIIIDTIEATLSHHDKILLKSLRS